MYNKYRPDEVPLKMMGEIGHGTVEFKNWLNEVPLADINQEELSSIQELEHKLGDRYYLIAFDRKE